MENVKFLNADIGAIDDINIMGEDIASQDIILYSAKGNITIDNSSNINFRGLIYAPNGTITLKTNNLNIDGTILAKNINLVSDVVNINNQSTLSNYILSQPKLEDTQIGDYTFEYDTFGTTENITCDGNTYLKYSYTGDLSHKLSKIEYINGDSQEYFYNSDGVLIGYSTNGKSSFDMKYEYDSDNKLTQKLDYKNNLKTCYSDSTYTVYKMDTNKDIYLYGGKINAVKFLPEPVQPDVLVDGTNLTYTYNCNLKEVKEKYSLKNSGDIVYIQKDGKNISYTYDQQRQLTCVDDEHLGLRYVYQYDEIGNLINKKTYELGTKQAASLLEQKTYDYDNEYPDRMIKFDDNTIKYDELGNPTQYGNWTMQWEQGRKLVELSSRTGDTIRYKYDDNNRVAKIVNGTETSYQYIGGKVYKQWDENNTITFDMDSKCDYLGFTLNGQKYNYVKNLLGDIIAVEDTDGRCICSYDYDPWGKCIITGDKEVGAINPIRYRGYYFDSETGFYYLGSRYYNPEVERFINADEYYLCIDNNMNMYKYCENNPMYYIDSTGYYAMQNSHVIDYVKDQVYYYINNKVDNIPTDVKYLIATVDGEAEGENGYCRKAVACAIVNRCQQRYCSDGSFQDTVSRKAQYSSYKGTLYQKCMNYLDNRDGSNKVYENIISTSLKVGYRIVSDSTSDSVLFYSPKSMKNGLPPKDWDFNKLKEVNVYGVDKNSFRFFKLK